MTRPAGGASDQALSGTLYALAAFGLWGFTPIYFKAVAEVPATEVFAHRVVWGALLLCAILLLRGRGDMLLRELRTPRRLRFYCASTLFLSCNWLVFIWAIQHSHILQVSLGYYINPLVNVLLGMVFLRERFSLTQTAAVVLAAAGVLIMVAGFGAVPWIALVLAFSFATYGLLRKTAAIGAMLGLCMEVLLLLPVALAYLGLRAWNGTGAFHLLSPGIDLLLMLAGPITALPLLCFLEAARRLRLSTLGLLQYLAPTLQFLLAVFAYGEPFDHRQLVTFACIWIALAVYSRDAFAARRAGRRAPSGPAMEEGPRR